MFDSTEALKDQKYPWGTYNFGTFYEKKKRKKDIDPRTETIEPTAWCGSSHAFTQAAGVTCANKTTKSGSTTCHLLLPLQESCRSQLQYAGVGRLDDQLAATTGSGAAPSPTPSLAPPAPLGAPAVPVAAILGGGGGCGGGGGGGAGVVDLVADVHHLGVKVSQVHVHPRQGKDTCNRSGMMMMMMYACTAQSLHAIAAGVG